MTTSSDPGVDQKMVDDTERWLQRRGVPVAEKHVTPDSPSNRPPQGGSFPLW